MTPFELKVLSLGEGTHPCTGERSGSLQIYLDLGRVVFTWYRSGPFKTWGARGVFLTDGSRPAAWFNGGGTKNASEFLLGRLESAYDNWTKSA